MVARSVPFPDMKDQSISSDTFQRCALSQPEAVKMQRTRTCVLRLLLLICPGVIKSSEVPQGERILAAFAISVWNKGDFLCICVLNRVYNPSSSRTCRWHTKSTASTAVRTCLWAHMDHHKHTTEVINENTCMRHGRNFGPQFH